jgi:hypothetical protein
MTRSKDIGTRAETAVVNLAQELGFQYATRLALSGANDKGDVMLSREPLTILEVKAGKRAQTASLGQISKWLKETDRERRNAGAIHAFLVVQRQGYGVGRVQNWEMWTVEADHYGIFCGAEGLFPTAMFELGPMLKELRDRGWL